MGSTDSVNWEYHNNIIGLIDSLKKTGLKIISVEQAESATTLNNFKYEKNTNYAFVFGNEINGVSQEVINASDEVDSQRKKQWSIGKIFSGFSTSPKKKQ